MPTELVTSIGRTIFNGLSTIIHQEEINDRDDNEDLWRRVLFSNGLSFRNHFILRRNVIVILNNFNSE